MVTTSITDVRLQPSGLWVITDAQTVRYATKDALLASAADRYRIKQTPVEVHSCAGGHYRELMAIFPLDKLKPARDPNVECVGRHNWQWVSGMNLMCKRCGTVRRDGGYGY